MEKHKTLKDLRIFGDYQGKKWNEVKSGWYIEEKELIELLQEYLDDDNFSTKEIMERWSKFSTNGNIVESMQSIKKFIRYIINDKEYINRRRN